MKKSFLIAVVFLLAAAKGFAQIKNPVEWKYEAKKKGAACQVVITATVQKPWHIYSQNTGKGGPIPTKITFNKNPLVTIEGITKETGKLEKVFDKSFNTEVLFYSNSLVFTQEIKVKAGVKTNITGTVEYMVCDDEQCLPPTKKTFDIKL
ncbi:protein-disulfide reductase DsbD domain-containing protein [Parasediminibacterium sp. JCM 36343]|uniref:protein-disulfide reductase DsbD domain-containing protein n=1 Tax=Parasediminibacterium sp. JCM 36343 TaxID=3374279 RepID=UPI00397B251D